MKKTILALSAALLTSVNVNAQQTPYKEMMIGGRIMYDMAVWGDSAMDNAGTEFIRVRFYNSGKLYGNIKYKFLFTVCSIKIKINSYSVLKVPVKSSGGALLLYESRERKSC